MTSASTPRRTTIWRKHYAIPADHGSWTWWIGPVAIGLAAGGRPGWLVVSLCIAALAAFLMHQPVTIAVKAWTGRRPKKDLKPALTWTAIYAFFVLLGTACLVASGHAKVLGLAAPGVLVFGWYLVLVSKKSERRQMLVEILGAGTMALGAPAAFWVAGGTAYPEPWVLWALTWVQSASAIVNVYLRLEQRRWSEVPPVSRRIQAGRLTLLVHLLGLGLAALFVGVGKAPPLVLAAYAFVCLDAVDTTLGPKLRARPAQIGIRQLVVWLVFVALMVLAYWR